MKNTDYIVIQGWMINELELKGTKLMVYALIYSYSRDGEGKFYGTIRHLEDATGNSRRSVMDALNSLVDEDLLIKESETINGVTFNRYKANLKAIDFIFTPRAEIAQGGVQNLPKGGAEIAPNISKDISNIDKSISTKEAYQIFAKSKGMNLPFFDLMKKAYGYSMEVIISEFKKWQTLNGEIDFDSERHMKNSFANWMRKYTPPVSKNKKAPRQQNGSSAMHELLEDLKGGKNAD